MLQFLFGALRVNKLYVYFIKVTQVYMAIGLGHDGRACCLDIGSATCSPVRRVRAKLVFLLFDVYILSTCFVHIGFIDGHMVE